MLKTHSTGSKSATTEYIRPSEIVRAFAKKVRERSGHIMGGYYDAHDETIVRAMREIANMADELYNELRELEENRKQTGKQK